MHLQLVENYAKHRELITKWKRHPLIEPTDIPQTDQTQVPVPIPAEDGIVRAAAVLAVGNVVSRVLGLAREIVKSNMFGTSDLLAAYTVAVLVPMTLFNLISGGEMVSSSLVPVFSDYAPKKKRWELWGVASTVLSLATIALIVIVLVVIAFAPVIAWLAGARNFDDKSLIPLTVDLMRLATPAVLFLSMGSIITGLLLALKRFTLPAFTTAVFNGTIVIVVLIRPNQIYSLVWGLLLGSFLQIVFQIPGLRDGRFKISFDWRHPAVRRIVILYAPIVAGLIVNQIAIWISYNLAITTGDNNVTYMTYATTLYQFPLGLIVSALSVATLPTLSQLATSFQQALDNRAPDAAVKLAEYKETLAAGLRLILVLGLPAATGLFALAGAIIMLIFEHGQFTATDTNITTTVLRVYLIGLPFAAIDQMLVFASYSRKDTWRPALVGVISIVIYTISAVVLLQPLGLLSLMVADAIKHIVHMSIMWWLLVRHLGGFRQYGMVSTLFKSIIAAVATGLTAFVVAEILSALIIQNDTFWAKMGLVTLAGMAGLLVYLIAVLLLDIQDAKRLRTIWSK